MSDNYRGYFDNGVIPNGFKETYVVEVEYGALENMILEHFPKLKEYQIACQEETGNDCSLTFNVSGELSKSDEKDIKEFKEGIPLMWRTGTILNYLCKEGYIPTGRYVINISW